MGDYDDNYPWNANHSRGDINADPLAFVATPGPRR